jgi:hypothetical protein
MARRNLTDSGETADEAGARIGRETVASLWASSERARAAASMGPPRPEDAARNAAKARYDKEIAIIARRVKDLSDLQRIQATMMADIESRLQRLIKYADTNKAP